MWPSWNGKEERIRKEQWEHTCTGRNLLFNFLWEVYYLKNECLGNEVLVFRDSNIYITTIYLSIMYLSSICLPILCQPIYHLFVCLYMSSVIYHLSTNHHCHLFNIYHPCTIYQSIYLLTYLSIYQSYIYLPNGERSPDGIWGWGSRKRKNNKENTVWFSPPHSLPFLVVESTCGWENIIFKTWV